MRMMAYRCDARRDLTRTGVRPRKVASQATEWQLIGNQVDVAMILARSEFVTVHGSYSGSAADRSRDRPAGDHFGALVRCDAAAFQIPFCKTKVSVNTILGSTGSPLKVPSCAAMPVTIAASP